MEHDHSDHPDFTVDSSGFSLTPGQQREVTVTFNPDSAGPTSATLTVASDDPDGPEWLADAEAGAKKP